MADKPRVWAETQLVEDGRLGLNRNYDLAPDGKRVLALVPVDGEKATTNHVIFLLNFLDELRRRVPNGK